MVGETNIDVAGIFFSGHDQYWQYEMVKILFIAPPEGGQAIEDTEQIIIFI